MKNENKIVIEFLIFCFLNANEGLNVIRLFPEFDNQRYPKCFTRKRTVYVFFNLALPVFSEGLRPYDFRCWFSILRPRAKRITFISFYTEFLLCTPNTLSTLWHQKNSTKWNLLSAAHAKPKFGLFYLAQNELKLT